MLGEGSTAHSTHTSKQQPASRKQHNSETLEMQPCQSLVKKRNREKKQKKRDAACKKKKKQCLEDGKTAKLLPLKGELAITGRWQEKLQYYKDHCIQSGAVKLVLWHHWMHVAQVHSSDAREPISLHHSVCTTQHTEGGGWSKFYVQSDDMLTIKGETRTTCRFWLFDGNGLLGHQLIDYCWCEKILNGKWLKTALEKKTSKDRYFAWKWPWRKEFSLFRTISSHRLIDMHFFAVD